MPNVSLPTGQDWDAVNVGRSGAGRTKAPKTAREITAAKATGAITTEKRCVWDCVLLMCEREPCFGCHVLLCTALVTWLVPRVSQVVG